MLWWSFANDQSLVPITDDHLRSAIALNCDTGKCDFVDLGDPKEAEISVASSAFPRRCDDITDFEGSMKHVSHPGCYEVSYDAADRQGFATLVELDDELANAATRDNYVCSDGCIFFSHETGGKELNLHSSAPCPFSSGGASIRGSFALAPRPLRGPPESLSDGIRTHGFVINSDVL